MSGVPQSTKLCPACGAIQPYDASGCSRCGFNFDATRHTAPPPSQQPAGFADPNWTGSHPRYYDQRSGQNEGLAIASLIVGIVSIPALCVCYAGVPLAIVGVIFGALSLRTRNRGMAIAGIACSAATLLLLVVLIIVAVMFNTWGQRGPFPSQFGR